MDEPFAALDAQTRDVLHVELTEMWRHLGTTIVFVTHNVREAVRLGDRVVVMGTRPGTVKQQLTIDLARPRELEGDIAYYSGRILKDLRGEVEKVMREEIDDAWEPQASGVPARPRGGLGDGI
jgi:NitT/TauT family transport system ATP-binding protein